jgi:hypothetical protein
MKRAHAGKKTDEELRVLAKDFLTAFDVAVGDRDDVKGLAYLPWEGALYISGKLPDHLLGALRKFASRAAQLLGPKAGNEAALARMAMERGQEFLEQGSVDTAAKALIDAAFDEADGQFEFWVANPLIHFQEDVRSITVGRVKAIATQEPECQAITNDDISESDAWWVVSVNCAEANVEEEAKWLINVAVSLLKLGVPFRSDGQIAQIEANAVGPSQKHRGGITLHDRKIVSSVALSRGRIYRVGRDVEAITIDPAFKSKAEIIFNAPQQSLAQRVSQGLGWLTRGRQAQDRAERLLYFFTAIEALLSVDDKAAPVRQTIARHAAVVLNNQPENRIVISSEIRKLYDLRSSVVHAGHRSVLWQSATRTQQLAEKLFQNVIEKTDLKVQHSRFCDQLSDASYGSSWPCAE